MKQSSENYLMTFTYGYANQQGFSNIRYHTSEKLNTTRTLMDILFFIEHTTRTTLTI